MKRRLLLALVAVPLFAAGPAAPAPDLLDGLVRDSPFLTPAGGRAAPGADAGPFELRSVVFEGGAYLFSIYDPSTKESAWVKLKEGGFPFVARSFDRERDTLTIDYQGRSLALSLQPTKTVASASQPPASPPPLPTQAGNAPQNSARNGPSPNSGSQPASNPANMPGPSNMSPAEAQRLQNLADEIRRRRNVGPPPTLPRN